MSLRQQLHDLEQSVRTSVAADALALMDRAAADLAASGQVDRALRVGDTAPDFTLPDAATTPVRLSGLLADGPVVLSFYRGLWCPYCNLQLRALNERAAEFAAAGARLVAISPQLPDATAATVDRHQLAFTVLSDVGAAVAAAYGLAFDLPADLADLYATFGLDLVTANGTAHARTLPIPATYLVAGDGTVAWAHVDSAYTRRAEPTDILKALTDLT